MKRRSPNTFPREFYESFIRIRGVPFTFISLLLTLLFFYLSENQTAVRLALALPILVLLLILILTLYDLSTRLYVEAVKPLPAVRQARRPPSIYPNASTLLLLDASEVYGHESLVSVYYLDEGFEVLVATGFVLTRQDDGFIQVLVDRQIEEAFSDIWDRACRNDSIVLSKLRVKPSLTRYPLGGMSA